MTKKNIRLRYIVVATIVVLLAAHAMLSYKYTGRILEQRLSKKHTYYVLTPEASKLTAFGMNDFASRMLVLYAVFNPLNENIPSIDFARLTQAMRDVTYLDPNNMQPYLHVAFFWSWNKKPESQKYMADYMMTGMNVFPESWEIPYSLYMFIKGEDNEKALGYLRIAAERAAEFNGPDWIVDYPAILMSNEGETIEAMLWLKETYEKTNNEKQRELILNKIDELQKELESK